MPAINTDSILGALRGAATSGSFPLEGSRKVLFWSIESEDGRGENESDQDQYEGMTRQQLIRACRAKDQLLRSSSRSRKPIPETPREMQIELAGLLDLSGRSENDGEADLDDQASTSRRDKLWRKLQSHLRREWLEENTWIAWTSENDNEYRTLAATLKKVLSVTSAVPTDGSSGVTLDERLKTELTRLSRSTLPLYNPAKFGGGSVVNGRFSLTSFRASVERSISTGRLDPSIVHPLLATAVAFSPKPSPPSRTVIPTPLLRLPRLPIANGTAHVRPGGEDVENAVGILRGHNIKLDGRTTYLVAGVLVVGEGDSTAMFAFTIHPCVRLFVLYVYGGNFDDQVEDNGNSALVSRLFKDIVADPSLSTSRPAEWRYELRRVLAGSVNEPSYADLIALQIPFSACSEESCIARPFDFELASESEHEVDIEQISFASTWGGVERAMRWAYAALGTIKDGIELAPRDE